MKYIKGNFLQSNNLSKYWFQVNIDPMVFLRDTLYEEYQRALTSTEDYYVDLSDDETACVRFRSKQDAENFKLSFLYCET